MSETKQQVRQAQEDKAVKSSKMKERIPAKGTERPLEAPGERRRQSPGEDQSHQNLKRIRTVKGVTLRELARISKLSVSYLSNYENGKANITISTLKKIALALGVSTSDLLTDGPGKDIVIVPKERRYIRELYEGETGTAYQEYMMRSNSAVMHVSIAKLPPHSDTGEPSSHYGEEFVFALAGSLCVILNNRTYRIEEGTMAYYNSSIFHKLANDGDTDAQYLHVNTPPTY